MPEYQKVKSSIIDRISWEDGNLYVRFLSGSLYVYFNVPEDVYSIFQQSQSKGQFLHTEIKDKYDFNKLY